MPLTDRVFFDALAGFAARPPRLFQHEGRSARDREGLEFIWRANGLEPPKSAAEAATPADTATSAQEAAVGKPEPFVPPVGDATPMPDLRTAAAEWGVPIKGKKADIVKAVNAAAKKAHADAAKAAKKAAGAAPAADPAAEAAKAGAAELRAELEAMSDDDLAGRAVAAGVEAEGKNRGQLIQAVIEAEA